jgi:hypothetical protein
MPNKLSSILESLEKKNRKEAKMWGQLKKSRRDLECGTKQKEKKGEDGTLKGRFLKFC